MTTPTDSESDAEWMSAKEAFEFLQLPEADATKAIRDRAQIGLIKARAKWFISSGRFTSQEQSDVEVPRAFWSPKGGWSAHRANWLLGDFETDNPNLPRMHYRPPVSRKALGVTFRRRDIEQLKPATAANPTATSPAQRSAGRTVFIGHGGHSLEWLKLEKFLRERLHLNVVEFNSASAAGVSTTERLNEMLGATGFAFLVLTSEDEQASGKFNQRLNVVHESGLFQGKLGFKKAIILREEGCEDFSNVHGLGEICFPEGNIAAQFEEVRRVLEREGINREGVETASD